LGRVGNLVSFLTLQIMISVFPILYVFVYSFIIYRLHYIDVLFF
jgi:hypothetical protein